MYTNKLFILILVIVTWSSVVEGSLYTEDDGVVILTSENIHSTIFLSEYAWFVEFYSTSCGHCRRYRHVMQNFSADIDSWKDLLKIGVIDCDTHTDICTQFQTEYFPTFRYFSENQINGTGRPVSIESTDTADSTRAKLVAILIDEQQNGRGSSFPTLQPIKGDDLKILITNSGKQYVLLIVQPPDSTLGAELVMYFNTVREIQINYSYDDNIPLLQLLGSDLSPSLYAVSKSGEHNALTVHEPTTKAFKAAIELFLTSKNIKVPLEVKHNHSQSVENQELIRLVKSMGDQVYLVDLESAIRFSLRNEVALKNIMTQPERQALKLFVELLRKYVPMSENAKLLMDNIQIYLSFNTIAIGAAIKQMVDAAYQYDENVFYTPQKWIGCVGESEAYRGYPCSLWKLFHYLTVNAALDPSFSYSQENVTLQAMHDYISKFFGCRNCQVYFSEMAERRQINQVLSREDAVLWLWEAHNEVNNRLHGDITEDKNFPKVQFPLQEKCPVCRDFTGEYDKTEVYKYLSNMYARLNINYYGSKIGKSAY